MHVLPPSRVHSAISRLRWVAVGAATALPVASCALATTATSVACAPTCTDPVEEARGFRVIQDAQNRLVPAENPSLSYASCEEMCKDAPANLEAKSCSLSSRPSGTTEADAKDEIFVDCEGTWAQCTNNWTMASGRRPEGYPSNQPLDSVLSEMARLEGASVIAFRRLAMELEFYGAPARMIDDAEAAAEDEIRHARLMTDLARRHGDVAAEEHPYYGDHSALTTTRRRSLFEIALENAREGVVNETFGALLNGLQADDAPDADVRALFATLADEELNHAALSLRVHRWLMSRLDCDEDRRRVGEEIRCAKRALRDSCAPHPSRGALLGQPSREIQLAILRTLDEEVLSLCSAA